MLDDEINDMLEKLDVVDLTALIRKFNSFENRMNTIPLKRKEN